MKRLLLAASGLALLAGPMAASAQDQQDWRGHNQNENRGQRQAPASREQSRPQQQYRAPQQNVQRYQPAPQYNGGYRNQGAQPTWRGPGPNGQLERAQPQPSYRGQQTYRGERYQAPMDRGGQYQYRNGGQYQYRNGGQYRGTQSYQNWSGRNFRLQGDWWRSRSGFRGYEGRRYGYWFAPGWGYYRVDPRWWGFDWVVGSIVPYELQSYVISDYWDYGLPPPPYGCEWIFLGDQIVLMDLGSGQIVEIAGEY
jgi:Ni/Co efflux regulator RcnB